MLLVLDCLSVASAMMAAFFWYQASGGILRRLRRFEDVEHDDYNRIVAAFNKTQQLNARAALATALSASCVAARFATSIVQTW